MSEAAKPAAPAASASSNAHASHPARATPPVVIGINRTQDASLCITDGERMQVAIQKERLTRHKHHWGRVGDLQKVYAPALAALDCRPDVIVECFSSDAEIRKLDDYEAELRQTLDPAPSCRRARISHHLAHLYSAFHPSPFESAAVMVIDGQGSAVRDFTEKVPGLVAPGHWREVASFYQADRRRVECLGKQLWDCDDTTLVGLGMFYFLLTQAIFPGDGNEGKVMGLAPYGDPNALRLPGLDVEDGAVRIPAAWVDIVHQGKRFRYPEGAGREHYAFVEAANLAAAGQQAFEDALVELACWLHERTGAEHLCFAGGTALNCSANQRLRRETPFRQIFIPPAPGDAGAAIGCALYGVAELLGTAPTWRWRTDALGPQPSAAAVESVVTQAMQAAQQERDLIVERIDDRDALAERMTELLLAGKVLGVCQGRSEFGPRALGQRSILADPRSGKVRDWINARVKQREWFRPLAPVVLAEHADDWFDVRGASPFMQFAVPVHPAVVAQIPAVTHVDRSARVQTVAPDDDPLLRRVLECCDARTGVPVLLNTSFNRREEPIVETPAEALATFLATPLHALVLPPFVLRKREETGI